MFTDVPRAATQLQPRATRARVLLLASAPAVLAVVVYLNALHNPFIYDDQRMIVENAALRSLHHVREIVWHDVSRPLVNLSYAVDYAVWGSSPFGFHVTNLLLHVLNVLLVFQIVRGVVSDRRSLVGGSVRPEVAALAGASLFAVHPMLTEAVGYISGRSDLMSAAFFLAAFLAGRHWMRLGGPAWWISTVVLWVLSLASKELAVVLPALLLCEDRFMLRGPATEGRRRLLRLLLPLMLAAAAGGLLRLLVLTRLEHPGSTTFEWRFALVELDVMRQYLVMLLVPVGQSIFHAVAPINGILQPRAMIAIGLVAGAAALAWRARRTDPALALGFCWFILLLLPSSALVVLDQGEPMAEHRVYLASVGLFLAMGSLGASALTRFDAVSGRARFLARALFVALLFSLCGRTVVRNLLWREPIDVWLEAAEKAPDHWLPRLVLGQVLHEAGRHEEAVSAYRTSMALRPQEQFTYAKLGACLTELGQFDEAHATFAALRQMNPHSAAASTGLGTIAMVRGESTVARTYFLAALRDPTEVVARQLLAMLEEGEHPADALRLCEEVRNLAPDANGNDDCIRRLQARLGSTGSGRD